MKNIRRYSALLEDKELYKRSREEEFEVLTHFHYDPIEQFEPNGELGKEQEWFIDEVELKRLF